MTFSTVLPFSIYSSTEEYLFYFYYLSTLVQSASSTSASVSVSTYFKNTLPAEWEVYESRATNSTTLQKVLRTEKLSHYRGKSGVINNKEFLWERPIQELI